MNNGRVRGVQFHLRWYRNSHLTRCALWRVGCAPQLSFWVKRWCQTNAINVANSGIDDNAFRGNNFAYATRPALCRPFPD